MTGPRPESLHIALVITALAPGGAERVMTLMANDWVARTGHSITLITYEEPGTQSYWHLDEHVKIVRLDLEGNNASFLPGLIRTARRIIALRRTFSELKPDVTIAFLTRVNIVTLLAAFGRRQPVIVSERNHPDRQPLGRLWLWLRDRTYRRAAAIVFQTEGAKSYYDAEIRKRGTVIPNPLTPIDAAQTLECKNNLVAVGRLTHQKGFDLLLQAFANISADFPDWTLTVWGEGEERSNLEALRNLLGLDTRVRLPGVTVQHGAWIEQASLFVLPSRFEGMPNVLLEAMAAGLPVVAFDCDLGPGEIIKHDKTGILVPPGDVDALAQSLARLMKDEVERKSLAREAAIAAEAFTPTKVMKAWSSLVESVTAHR